MGQFTGVRYVFLGKFTRTLANCTAARIYIPHEKLEKYQSREFTGAPSQQFKALI